MEYRWRRDLEDITMLVPEDQVQKYEKSGHANRARALFKFLSDKSKSISQTEFCLLGDHLFSIIHFGNGHRSGVTANFLMTEMDHRGEIKENGFVRIPVDNHKTFYLYGPANIILQREI